MNQPPDNRHLHNMPTVPAAAVANEFLSLARNEGKSISTQKLMKLVIYAHGWTLGLAMRALIQEPVIAWKYGPMIESLYLLTIKFGGGTVEGPLKTIGATGMQMAKMPENHPAMGVIRTVWEVYKNHRGEQLSHMLLHTKNAPWTKTCTRMGVSDTPPVIPDMDIATVFQNLAEKAR